MVALLLMGSCRGASRMADAPSALRRPCRAAASAFYALSSEDRADIHRLPGTGAARSASTSPSCPTGDVPIARARPTNLEAKAAQAALATSVSPARPPSQARAGPTDGSSKQ